MTTVGDRRDGRVKEKWLGRKKLRNKDTERGGGGGEKKTAH